jgi:hypothetical protein
MIGYVEVRRGTKPVYLASLDQRACPGGPGGLGAGPLGDLGPIPDRSDRGEGHLNGVGSARNAAA